jgi:hypothetical protein
MCKKNIADRTKDTPSFLEHLTEVGRKVSSAKVYNPMVEEFGKPLTPRFLNPSGIRFGFHVPGPVFSGQDCLVSLKVNNETDEAIGNLKMETLVFNKKLKKVFEKWDNLGELEPDNERFFSIPVKSVPESTHFVIRSQIRPEGGDALATSFYSVVLDRVFCSVSYVGPEGGDINSPFHTVPFVLRIKQTSTALLNVKADVKLMKLDVEDPVLEQELELTLPPEREVLFYPGESGIREEIKDLLKGLGPKEVEIKPAKAEGLGSGGQFYVDVRINAEDGVTLARTRSEPFKLGKE